MSLEEFVKIYLSASTEIKIQIEETLDSLRRRSGFQETILRTDGTIQPLSEDRPC